MTYSNLTTQKSLPAICLLLVCFLAVPLSAESVDSWQSYSPREIHQMMIDGKARSLAARDFVESSGSNAASTQTNYDVLFYDVDLRVNDTTSTLYGRVTFVAAAVAAVSQIEIDFYSNMAIDSIVSPSGVLNYGRTGNVVVLDLGQTYSMGQQFTFDFYYHGTPVTGGFQGFSFDWRNGYRMISSLSEPYLARTWWPCKDRMDDKPDSMRMAIEVLDGYYVGSNGTLDSMVNSSANTDTYYYTVHYPIATYLFSVAIYPYYVWEQEYIYNGGQDTMPIVQANYPDLTADAMAGWGITPTGIQVLSDIFGPYPFLEEKYGHANFEWSGGMEHQTMTSMMGAWFGFSEPVVIHELSHQWWGDMITCESWRDLWLNEGWASYAEALWYEARGGKQDYLDYMTGMEYYGRGPLYLSDTSSVGALFTSLPYDKGAWLLHMLRYVIGDSLFFAGIDAYYHSQYQYASATSQDFENLFEQVSGQDLTEFFADWLYGTYVPHYYHYKYSEPSPNGGHDAYVAIVQVQTTQPRVFDMPLDVKLYLLNGSDTTFRVYNNQREQVYAFNVAARVDSVEIDPENWVLNYATAQPWLMFIVTPDSALHDAAQYVTYTDTIEARGGSGVYSVSIIGGALPVGYAIDSHGVISGNTVDTGLFNFTVRFDDPSFSYRDERTYDLRVEPTEGMPGDVTGDMAVDISDITYLVNALFLYGPPPISPALADVNADCQLDISDLTYLVTFLFLEGPPPQMGCAK